MFSSVLPLIDCTAESELIRLDSVNPKFGQIFVNPMVRTVWWGIRGLIWVWLHCYRVLTRVWPLCATKVTRNSFWLLLGWLCSNGQAQTPTHHYHSKGCHSLFGTFAAKTPAVQLWESESKSVLLLASQVLWPYRPLWGPSIHIRLNYWHPTWRFPSNPIHPTFGTAVLHSSVDGL